jgi:phosphohistidine phosphatase SixA
LSRPCLKLDVEVHEEAELGDDVSLSELESILARAGEPERVVLVGHEPDFSALIALLVGASRIPMKKGALARIDVKRPLAPGGGILRWLVPPDLLGSPAADDS